MSEVVDTELVEIQPRLAPVPITGEAIDLDGPLEDIARVYREVQDVEQELRTLKQILSREVHDRMDKQARWTERVGGLEVRGEGPNRTEFDPDALRKALLDLEELDLISESAAAAALEVVVTLKPRKAGISALLKIPGEVSERVKACERVVEKPRRLTVKRVKA